MNETNTSPSARKLGNTGANSFPLALGCMAMSGAYGTSDERAGIATIHAAIEHGVTLLDTGDFYEMGDNEMLVRRAIEGRRSKVQLSVKFGAMRSPDGAFVGVDNRPVAVKNFASYSLRRLGVEVIDVYRPARLDATVPIEDTVGAIADLIRQGYVRHVGLSEVGADTLRRAHAVHPIADLQIEYSLASRSAEAHIFPVLSELGIGATLYGVLSRGLLSGRRPSGPRDFRTYLPRFSQENLAKNEAVVARLHSLAEARGMTVAQLSVAWVLAKQPSLVPLIGPRTPQQLIELLGALERPLSPADVEAIERAVPSDAILGQRYQAAQMAHLDSER